MANRRELYKLEPAPLDRGGYSEVFRATRRADGKVVAFKRSLGGAVARERLRREIEVQARLAHPNIMPVWESDAAECWFTMPLAEGNLEKLRDGVDEEEFVSILMGIGDALHVAHGRDYVHRDVTPRNILALPHKQQRRWVIADWGLVRRPYGSGSVPLTAAGIGLGTEGFAAPEVLADARGATPAADVYSLGRVAGWYLTRRVPRAGCHLLPEGALQHWRSFVRACTEPDVPQRVGDMQTFRQRLDQVFTVAPGLPAARAHEIVDRLLLGHPVEVSELYQLASDYPDDVELYLDELARLPSERLSAWAQRDAPRAAAAARRMSRHLLESPWLNRDAEYASTPLAFVHAILQSLAEIGKLGLAEDVAEIFFNAEVHWRCPSQRARTRAWLITLDNDPGRVIARVLARAPAAASYYRPLAPLQARSSAVNTVLTE